MPMDDHASNHHIPEDHTDEAPRPKRPTRPRWRRPNGRWTNPATPLQAARFALRMSGKDVAAGIRRLCEGHAGRACKFEVSKLSDFEHARRRPSLEHVAAFCKLYQRSPEELGLIRWRDEVPSHPEVESEEPAEPDSGPGQNGCECGGALSTDQEQRVTDWLRDCAEAVANAVMQAVAEFPLKPGSGEEPSGPQSAGDDGPPEEGPPAGVGVPG